MSEGEIIKGQMLQLQLFLKSQLSDGQYMTKRNIEDGYLEYLKMTRAEFKRAYERSMAAGTITFEKLPAKLKKGH